MYTCKDMPHMIHSYLKLVDDSMYYDSQCLHIKQLCDSVTNFTHPIS